MATRYGLWGLVLILAIAFLLLGSGFDFEYVIPKRLTRLAAMALPGSALLILR